VPARDRRLIAKTQPGDNPVNRAVVILTFLGLALALPAEAEDVHGWQDAKWGMTPDEVQKAVSHPTFEADLAKLCSKDCQEGAVLELDDYELDGQHFTVRFWFTKPDKRLQAVSLYAKQLNDDDHQAYDKIKRFLENLYGSAQSSSLMRGYFEFTWKLPSTKITLYSNTTSELTIIYEERADKESGKS
jgi:hypothetical protein